MALIELTCPNCSASLPPREESGHYQCDYCGTRFQAAAPKPQPRPVQINVGLGDLGQASARAQKAASKWALLSLVITLGMTGLIAGLTFYMQDRVTDAIAPVMDLPQQLAGLPQAGDMPGMPKQNTDGGPARDSVLWDDVAGLPQPVMIGETEAVIGRVRARPGDQLHVKAYDARTLLPLYAVGPLGTYGDAYRNTYYLAKENTLVVSNYRNALHLHDLQTGQERHKLTLSDRVEYLCDTGNEGEVWVAIADKRHLLVNLQSGEAKASKRPKGCAKSHFEAERKREHGRTRGGPKVAGFKTLRVHVDGEHGVAAGSKSPGTPLPLIVGFDPKTKKVRWQEELFAIDPHAVEERSNQFDDLTHGYYVGTYKSGADRWHLAAFDAESGKRLWDTEMSDIFAVDSLDGVVATKTSVFVVRTSSLDIYDAKTGALVGAIGNETYE